MAPKDENELRDMLFTRGAPGSRRLRYPGPGQGVAFSSTLRQIPSARRGAAPGQDLLILPWRSVYPAWSGQELEKQDRATVVNARFINPG